MANAPPDKAQAPPGPGPATEDQDMPRQQAPAESAPQQ